MRLYLRALGAVGVVERRSRREFPTSVDYAITPPGRRLLEVGEVLEGWLGQAPDEPRKLGTVAARNAIKSLIEGWSTDLIRALAGRSLSLTELDRRISRVSYPSLERRLGALRIVGLVEGHRMEGGATPYAPTDWLRRAVGPWVAASAWEKRFLPESSPPIGRPDIEAAFLLTVPLMKLPRSLTGKCKLAVEVQGGAAPGFAGVFVCVEGGRVVSCSSRLEGEAEGWASGTTTEWLRRLNGHPEERLEVGGDVGLVHAVTDALRAAATSEMTAERSAG